MIIALDRLRTLPNWITSYLLMDEAGVPLLELEAKERNLFIRIRLTHGGITETELKAAVANLAGAVFEAEHGGAYMSLIRHQAEASMGGKALTRIELMQLARLKELQGGL